MFNQWFTPDTSKESRESLDKKVEEMRRERARQDAEFRERYAHARPMLPEDLDKKVEEMHRERASQDAHAGSRSREELDKKVEEMHRERAKQDAEFIKRHTQPKVY